MKTLARAAYSWGCAALLCACATPLHAQLVNMVAVSHDAEIVARDDSVSTFVTYDYGDAPDPTYPTLVANDGARHVVTALRLGVAADLEIDGQPNGTASGDAGDEDGVLFTSPIDPGQMATLTITASGVGLLDAWIDFNLDGDWGEANEQIFTSEPLVAGANNLMFAVPAGAVPNVSTFARFRISSAGGLAPTGVALDGEVEDYQPTLVPVELMSFSID
ncbi:MAG: GEVED domain-containing protein [Acidobacteriota bacterium]